MKRSQLLPVLFFLLAANGLPAQSQTTSDVDQVTVFYEEGRFAGWPANHGIWSWGDEILVRFNVGWLKDMGEKRHAYDGDRPPEMVWARSMDGGRTWNVDERESSEGRVEWLDNSSSWPPSLSEEPRNFLDPNLALFIKGAHWRYSTDRGHSWNGWYPLPEYDVPLKALSNYLIDGPHKATAFIGTEIVSMTPILVFRTEDAGSSWNMISEFGVPGWYEDKRDFITKPSPVRLSPTEIIVATRRGEPERIEVYKSADNGETWTLQSTPLTDSGGTTPNLFGFDGGRVVLTYGFRSLNDGSGIRGRISEDHGNTWGDEIVLRGDAGNWDLGYPLTVQRLDGRLVTVYYFNDDPDKERFIGATIWTPPEA